MLRLFRASCLCTLLGASAAQAEVQPVVAARPDLSGEHSLSPASLEHDPCADCQRGQEDEADDASIISRGLHGFFAGAIVGVSAGYALTSARGVDEPWRGMLVATGAGALSGAGLGLALGRFDATRRSAPARFVMRDATYGTVTGGLLGAAVGGLVALHSRDGQDVLFGAALGAISGFGAGVFVGVVQGRAGAERRLAATLNVSRDVAGRRALGPGVIGHF